MPLGESARPPDRRFPGSHGRDSRRRLHPTHRDSPCRTRRRAGLNFPTNSTTFGVQRNGTWSEVIIPLSNFQNPAEGRNIDLYSVKNAFMFAGDPATGAADFFFDDVYFSGGIAPNPPPTVSITAPLNNAVVVSPANVVINADATDANGTVTQVDFYSGTTLLGTDATSPYSYTMPSPAVGAYVLTAKATDNQGARSSPQSRFRPM